MSFGSTVKADITEQTIFKKLQGGSKSEPKRVKQLSGEN